MPPHFLSNPVQILVLGYLLVILTIGLIAARHAARDEVSYLLMGRRLSLPAFVASLVSTWYGGILGIGEFTYRHGLLNWLTQGLPYYFFAFLFALFLAGRIRQSNLFTLPDQLYENYGKSTGLLGSILVFLLSNPAPHLLMVALLLSTVFAISYGWAFAIAVLFSVTYVFFGGLKADVYTDIAQAILMFTGFGLLVTTLIFRYGGWAFLSSQLPPDHLRLGGGEHWQYILVWFFIALWTFVDPGFYQRCYAAKSPKVAKLGILFSILFWLGFDFLTTTAGLYARALLPGIEPLYAFPLLGQKFLPPLWSGLFFISLLATVMSTLDSNSLIAASTFGRDFIWRLKPQRSVLHYTRLGLVVTILIALVIIEFAPSVVKIWYLLGSLCIPALLLPVLCALLRLSLLPRAALTSMVAALLATICWFGIGVYRGSWTQPQFVGNIQPFFMGIAAALAAALIVQYQNLHRKNRAPGDSQHHP